ncbi:MAG: zinc ribbon domain-containing protein [Thermoflexales bacterium]|nr:zinc ribbon domain-containing protein [Thermoflexales bacterium]
MGDEVAAFRCSGCGSTLLIPNPDGTLTCAYCGTTYEITGRACPECGAVNPPEAEHCIRCGRVLDLVGLILQSRLQTTRERLEQVRAEAARLKEESEAASQERLRRWWAEEEERRRALAAAQAERDRQERMLLTGALVFAAIVILGILIYLLVTALSAP